MNNSPETQIEEIFPEGVELHPFDDVEHWREDIYQKAQTALASGFPREYGRVSLELSDLEYADPATLTPAEEREHLMHRKKAFRRLRGTVTLRDKETGEVLDSTKKTLMGVPYLSGRGTFIHNGSNYVSIRQARLRPGVYTRRKRNNELEAHYNVAPGSGKPFRIALEPETALFRFQFGGSNLKLYSILRDLGVEDETLREAWGDYIFKRNQEKYDTRDSNKLFTKMFPYEDADKPRDEKLNMIKERLFSGKLERDVVRRTLGTHN